ncbi:High-affinity nickel-transporter [Cryptosporangium japonicum]|uniref:High-affinity nickel-transporter n=1 Tax=Cryptosporangium japonicum TaxID=80872 RepID=A0ABN0V5R2_9ACTN
MIGRSLAVLVFVLLSPLMLGTPALAHPLGNFTTNQYAGLRVTSTGVDVDFVLDLAELPAYQARTTEIDTDRDGTGSPAENDTYATRTCAAAAAGVRVDVGGRHPRLTAEPVGLTFPAGAGGLATLRLQCTLHADARITTTTTIGYRTTLYADRIGWREITALGDRYTLTHSDVPTGSVSKRLTAYPAGVVSDVRSATLRVRPGGPAADPLATTTGVTQNRGVDRFTAWFTRLIGHPQLTLGVGLLAFLIALVLGGAHAVAPGHGKTIMAAYLLGSRGRARQALTVAGTVAATHTLGVLALGVLFATSLQLAPDTMYGWLRLISGILVTLVGAHLLYQAVRRKRVVTVTHHHHADELVPAGHLAAHSHAPHTSHAHSHGGRPHTHHLPGPGESPNVRSLLAMGFAGGLSPSPSAVVVLLGAAALGRVWYGVLLVLAYGIGLAATLTGIGFALAHWRERLHRASAGRWRTLLTRRLPIATATLIVLVGLGMTLLAAPQLF